MNVEKEKAVDGSSKLFYITHFQYISKFQCLCKISEKVTKFAFEVANGDQAPKRKIWASSPKNNPMFIFRNS